MLGQRPGKPLDPFRVVLREEHRASRQAAVPAVLADRGEEPVQQADMAALPLLVADHLSVQVGQIAFQHRSVDLGDLLDARPGKESGEAGDHPNRSGGGFQPEPTGDPPPYPPFGQIPQP
jgi:hypothetical protein